MEEQNIPTLLLDMKQDMELEYPANNESTNIRRECLRITTVGRPIDSTINVRLLLLQNITWS